MVPRVPLDSPVGPPVDPPEHAAVAPAGVEAALGRAITQGLLPGAVVHIEQHGHGPAWVGRAAVGRMALEPQAQALQVDTVYDVASLTKPVVTAPVLLRLAEGGALDLATPLRAVLPAFGGGKGVTLRHLLTHTSGLPASLPLERPWQGEDEAVALACASAPTHPPDEVFRYSDINFVLLGSVVRRVAGEGLDALARRWLFEPLGMRDSAFLPLRHMPAPRIAPTAWTREVSPAWAGHDEESDPGHAHAQASPRMLRGVVHDPTARRMGGVAGHAGLFSTAADLARYARMLLHGGTLDGAKVLAEATVARMLAVATPTSLAARRALGWDVDTPLSRARGRPGGGWSPGSAGHTGFTGCALWVDPARRAFHVLLSNRVHPVARQSIVALYEEVATLAAQAVPHPPGPRHA